MTRATDQERFAAARQLPACRAALAQPIEPLSWRPVVKVTVAMIILAAALAPVMIAMHDRMMLALLLVPLALAGYAIAGHLRARRQPGLNVLAIVGAAGSAAIGDAYGGPAGTARFLVLRTEDGEERSFPADAMAAAGIAHGDIGVAAIRGGEVVAFEQLSI